VLRPLGQEAGLAPQPQDAAPVGAEAGEAKPDPQLAAALAGERAAPQELSDRRDQGLVRPRPGPPACGRRWAAVAVDGGPRHAPDPGDPL
jgi:hypothetical protein